MNIYVLVAIGVAVMVGAGAIRQSGVMAERAKTVAERERRYKEVAEFVVDNGKVNQGLRDALTLERGNIKIKTVTLQGKVADYVSSIADKRCDVPAGFVQHHNAAWGMPNLPGPASGFIDAPSGIPLSSVAAINAGNAGACRDIAAEAGAWRGWYTTNKARHNAFAGATQGESQAVPSATKGR